MTTSGLHSLPDETLEQAIQWSIRMTYNRPDPETCKAFAIWLSIDESHRLAWTRLQGLSGRFEGVPAAMGRQALEKLPETRLRRRQMLNLLALCGVSATAVWTARDAAPWQRLLADYSTRVGERRRWTLSDGSVLELNTDTAVRLHFSADARVIELLRGELYLTSSADGASARHRPLRVINPFGSFEALGTRFGVRQYPHSCKLEVNEGAVQLISLGGKGSIAQAGETWAILHNGVQRLAARAQEPAWRDGMLIARSMPLGTLVGELGRYRNGYLGCDPRIAQRIISGNFNLDDIDATLAFIAQTHDLRLQTLTRYWMRFSV
ncbi:FecR domain-containing protein [Pseudomonas cremoricolorata]|uniref:FecR domain-containing protein n=1 Tax=Pseudomonas cremoricolorata TaxID=157783 RepID=UPI00048A4E32|nr:FecR family protein [Pseudomonas cremoricolorata]